MMEKNGYKKLFMISAAVAVFSLVAAPAFTNPMASPAAKGDVSSVYGSKCSICHAKNGAGVASWRAKGQPDFTDPNWQKSQSDAQIANAIKNGKGKSMPAFKSKLSDEEISSLVGLIRSFGKRK